MQERTNVLLSPGLAGVVVTRAVGGAGRRRGMSN
jgi:hypothetical protein